MVVDYNLECIMGIKLRAMQVMNLNSDSIIKWTTLDIVHYIGNRE